LSFLFSQPLLIGIQWLITQIRIVRITQFILALVRLTRDASLTRANGPGVCVVLEICPVDLLVPIDLGEYQPYRVAPNVAAAAGNVREWVRGEDLLIAAPKPKPPIYKPVTLLNSIRWMSADRANRVAERYFRKKEKKEDSR